jgi:hypothetical protein
MVAHDAQQLHWPCAPVRQLPRGNKIQGKGLPVTAGVHNRYPKMAASVSRPR